MTVHLYALCWNDAHMLGFFFRHYDPWIDRYVIFDDDSSDGSRELLQAHPRVELRRFERSDPDSFAASARALQDQVWKESRGRADWAVITAIDEHLWVPGRPMREVLARHAAQGVTFVPALGYQMVSEEFPEPGEELCQSRTRGAPWRKMSKLSLLVPDAIEETNFGPGRHKAAPTGNLRPPERDELLLLHYKFLDAERLLERQAMLRTRLGSTDVARGWGHHWDGELARAEWERFAAAAIDVSAPGLDAHHTHPGRRWWRRGRSKRRRDPGQP
jgi:hypothetical protein